MENSTVNRVCAATFGGGTEIIMWTFSDLIRNFFTHKDFLPPSEQLPGSLFTPLHFAFAALCLALVVFFVIILSKKDEKTIRTVFAVLWSILLVYEIVQMTWEICAGEDIYFEATGVLRLYPCSIFIYAMPFAIWGRGKVRAAACGYVCTLGLLGGAINFVYPANVLSNYSCISFAGFHTFIFHGSIVFCAAVMMVSGYHRFTHVTKWWQLFLSSVPFLIVSVAANIVNFSPIDSDYMFFKLNSFIFAPIGAATPDWLSVLIVYAAYILIQSLPYLPSYISNKVKAKQEKAKELIKA